jgi:beta-N-acetylhexosaminidase
MTASTAAIFGCAGTTLSDDERRFFSEVRPVGLILFSRNCDTPDQVRDLVRSWRDCGPGNDGLVLIDQEGGRVARLAPPHWRRPPAAAALAVLVDAERAVRLNARIIANDLRELGIDVDCVPVLDVPVPGSDAIIGDRAFGTDPELVSRLGRVMAEALIEGGVLPVIKHVPGHGRATVDSHQALPVVDTSADVLAGSDFVPFVALRDMPLAMTAHVVYAAIDPSTPATMSTRVIETIRSGIGFDGILMTDDLSMKALSGDMRSRSERSRAAGCDIVLHCNGMLEEMSEVAAGAGPLDAGGARRLAAACERRRTPGPFDRADACARLDSLLGNAAR